MTACFAFLSRVDNCRRSLSSFSHASLIPQLNLFFLDPHVFQFSSASLPLVFVISNCNTSDVVSSLKSDTLPEITFTPQYRPQTGSPPHCQVEVTIQNPLRKWMKKLDAMNPHPCEHIF